MENLDKLPNLAKAVVAVMKEVKNIEKNSAVGTGQSSYKGVEDKDVKLAIGQAMEKQGLCLLPIGVIPTMHIERWEETTQYGNNAPVTKPKQQVLTEVVTKYLLLHESGESIELTGYGHGVDSQDKSAGKSTTYALKYLLLYTFMVPTGKIDDADAVHSNDHQQAPAKQQPAPAQPTAATKAPTALTDDQFNAAMNANQKQLEGTLNAISKKTYTATPAQQKQLEDKLADLKAKK